MAKYRKPTNLRKLRDQMQSLYSTWRTDVTRARQVYDKQFARVVSKLPEGVPIHEASTARILADNLADQIRTDEPRISFKSIGTSIKAQRHKELMELWGQHCFEQIARGSLIDPWEQGKKDLIISAAACVKYIVDVEALPEPPQGARNSDLAKWRAQRADIFSYDVRPVDPLQIYIAPTRKAKPPYVLEVQRRLAADVAEDYPEWTDPKRPRRPGDDTMLRTVEWLEYWSKDHYIVEVDGVTIIDKPNPYGEVPYAWRYNGLGRIDVSGSLSALGESILSATMGEFEAEVRLKTAMDAQWQFHVFPRLITTMPASKARRMFQKGPGSIITVASMEDEPKYLAVEQPNQAMYQFLTEIKSTIAQRFPPGLNQRPAGVEAAVHQALLQGQALKPLLPIRKNLNALATEVINGMARQAAALKLEMNVYGKVGKTEKERMVTPSDLTHFNFEVKFEATDPSEDDRKILTGLAVARVPGIISRLTLRERFMPGLNLKSEEEEEQIIAEKQLDLLSEQGLLLQSVMQAQQMQEQQENEQAMAGAARTEARQAVEQFVPGARERGAQAITGQPVRGVGEAQGRVAEETSA